MIRAIHVDRFNICQSGAVLTLDSHGRGPHGQQFNKPYLYPPYSEQEWNDGALQNLNDALIEHFFELYRQAHFPDRPSRFACWFGSETSIPDSDQWFNKPNFRHYPIWILESETHFRADASLLRITSFGPDQREYFNPEHMSQYAHYYWSGKTRENLLEDFGETPNPQADKPQWELLLVPPVRVIAPYTISNDP